MSTQFTNRQWRLPNNENKDKQSNYSMDFDSASSDKITGTGALISGNEPRSFSLWYKTTSGTFMIPFSLGNPDSTLGGTNTQFAYCINRQNSPTRAAIFGRGNDVSPITVPETNDGNWHHLVVTYDQVLLKVYIDGSLEANPSLPPSNYSTNNGFSIGGWSVNDREFDGSIDAVSIFNYALSASQVTTLYGSSSTGIGNPMSLSPKPVAYYPLGDQDAFNGADYLVPNSSLKDYVFDFSGGTDNISVPQTSTLEPSNVTVSVWVNWKTGSNTYSYAINKDYNGSNGSYAITRVNQPRFYIYTSTGVVASPIASSVNLTDTGWHHLVGTYDGSYVRFYVNGEEIGSGTAETGSIIYNTGDLIIGSFEPSGNLSPNGEQSNVQIFNTALPATDVETLYNYGSPIRTLANIPQNSNLKAWYKLDASEVYNSSTTEWEINNALSSWTSSLSFGSNGTSHAALGLNSALPTTAITLSLWVRSVDNSQNYKPIFLTKSSISGQDASIYILAFSTGNVGIKIMTDAGFKQNFGVPAGLNDNKWHHISVTYDGTNIAYYTDGDLYTTDLLSGTISYDTTTYPRPFIGANPSATSSYFKGEVSNFQIFNTALPATGSNSVETLYNNGNPLTDISSFTSLLNWYKLDNLTTGIEDSKGTQNGTNSGAVEAVGSVSTLNGESSGMTQANLVQSDLSFTSGYSPYALDFDGTNDYIDCGNSLNLSNSTTPYSISLWLKTTSTGTYMLVAKQKNSTPYNGYNLFLSSNKIYFHLGTLNLNSYIQGYTNTLSEISNGNWHHLMLTYNGNQDISGFNIYLNNSNISINTVLNNTPSGVSNSESFLISARGSSSNNGVYFNGSLSNISYWNTALTSAQVTEIYSEGVPSNLNNHSAYSNLVSWWQLGSNSSFNSTLNQWTCIDEKGTNTGESSQTFNEDAIVDGVGSYANGLSSGMGGDEVIGDAPYSSSNALSVNMDVLDRVEDTPS